MVSDAESHRAEDAALRQAIDARNELDSVAYQVERRLEELGDAVPAHERARAEMLVADARQAVKEEAALDRIRSLTAELQGVYQGLLSARQGAPSGAPGNGGSGFSGGGGAGPSGGASPGGGGRDDDVIDAEFTPS
jgi:molecular chaperone DnaK